MKNQYPRPERLQILQALDSMWLPYAIQAAAYFDFATAIGNGEKTTEELAAITDAKEGWVYRVLRFLAAHDIFEETGHRAFSNTPVSNFLRQDQADSAYWVARMMGSDRYRKTWGTLEKSMRTGQPAVNILYNQSLYEYLTEHPDEGQIFDNAMGNLSMMGIPSIIHSVDFSRFHTVIDVGGGNGTLLLKILEQYPSLHGVLFERPKVIEQAKSRGVDATLELVVGDFTREIPPAGDAYIFKEVFHNLDDGLCLSILTRCKQTMPPHAVILVCEQVINNSTLGALTKGLDILMGLEQRGHERTEEEFRSLFQSAGFEVKIIPTYPPQWIFEASPKP